MPIEINSSYSKAHHLRPEHYFYLTDGKILQNMEQLSTSLKDMNETVFKYHVNEDKNDFANWVRDVFGKQELAQKMQQTKNKDLILKEIKKDMFKEKARMILDLPASYFKTVFKKDKPVDAKKQNSVEQPAEKKDIEKEISKKLDMVIEKENEIEEQELLLKRKIEGQRKLAEANLLHGFAIGMVICLVILIVYMILR